jgi:hypothetical protein
MAHHTPFTKVKNIYLPADAVIEHKKPFSDVKSKITNSYTIAKNGSKPTQNHITRNINFSSKSKSLLQDVTTEVVLTNPKYKINLEKQIKIAFKNGSPLHEEGL